MAMWLGVTVLTAIIALLIFKRLARRSFERGREPQPLAEMHAPIRDQVSAEVFKEVWSKVGEVFAIDPHLIRSTDTLKTLANMDSWDLGEGGDALSRWLEQEQLGKPPALETVLDLAKWVQDARASRKDAS
ncbi:hypothetical protein [Variovorax sp. JS1663]|uniref:hypothetical protein n=1 Tax=Variovorax sp. JS1663 TaxID=1851577 RepID=UPI00117E5437|nr:hypothetical protein [Variovorax sp. JS1663]